MIGQIGPSPDQGADLGVDLGELAVVDRDRVRARVAGVLARPEAVHERPRVLQREPLREQRTDLRDEPYVGLLVLPVAVGPAPCGKQALLLVIAQRPRTHTRAFGQLTDTHRPSPDSWPTTTLILDTGVKVKPAPALPASRAPTSGPSRPRPGRLCPTCPRPRQPMMPASSVTTARVGGSAPFKPPGRTRGPGPGPREIAAFATWSAGSRAPWGCGRRIQGGCWCAARASGTKLGHDPYDAPRRTCCVRGSLRGVAVRVRGACARDAMPYVRAL